MTLIKVSHLSFKQISNILFQPRYLLLLVKQVARLNKRCKVNKENGEKNCFYHSSLMFAVMYQFS